MQTACVVGEVIVSADGGKAVWCMTEEQAKKMLPMFEAGVGAAVEKIPALDKQKIIDAAQVAESKKAPK